MPDELIPSRLRVLSEPGAILDPEVLARVLDALRVAVLIIDHDGVLRYVNHRTELLFGYPRTALLGEKVEMLLPERFRQRHEAHRARFFTDPRPRQMGIGMEFRGLRRDGTEIELEIELTPIVVAQGVYVVGELWRRRDDAPNAA